MDPFNPTALTRANPLTQRNAKPATFSPGKPSELSLPILSWFQFSTWPVAFFQRMFSSITALRYFKKRIGRNDPHIPIRRRRGTNGYRADIPFERWKRILNLQYNCVNICSLFQTRPNHHVWQIKVKETFFVPATYPTHRHQHHITTSPISQQWLTGYKVWHYTLIRNEMKGWRHVWSVESHMTRL